MSAVQAEFVNFKNVPTRKSAQLIFEVPIENLFQCLKTLGMPDTENQVYVGIARLQPDVSNSRFSQAAE